MTNITGEVERTFALLDAAEERHREEARSRTTQEPVTPEQHQEQFAAELATRLRDSQSTWVTFT